MENAMAEEAKVDTTLGKDGVVFYRRLTGEYVTWLVERLFNDQKWARIQFGPDSFENEHSRNTQLLTSEKDIRKAVELQRRLGLISVAERLMETSSQVRWAKKSLLWEDIESQTQNTWVFIVYGNYNWRGVYATVVKTSPWVTTSELNKCLLAKFPSGFENIPANLNNLPSTTPWNLSWYQCLELTEKAATLIDWSLVEI